MVGLKRMIRRRSSLRDYVVGFVAEKVHCHCPLPSQHLARLTPKRFLDLHQFVNKKAIEEERARLGDEMKRGYFADMAEFKQHGGKIGVANKVIIPAMAAVKFPDLEVSFSDGKTMKLPIRVSDLAVGSDKSSVPKASLVCLSFRASSQEMINSWSAPFLEAFRKSKGVHLYQGVSQSITSSVDPNVYELGFSLKSHRKRPGVAAANCSDHPEITAHLGRCGWQRVIPLFIPEPTFWDFQSSFGRCGWQRVSFIDSWLLCRPPIKRFLLWTMKKPNNHESKDTLEKHMVYSFGDHYYFRKELQILNLLTGYIFLLDNFGRVRWQGFGLAKEDEISSLHSCTSLLLDEK